MNEVNLFEEWIEVAKELGYQPRFEYFGGTGGGVCRVGQKKWLFVDLANSQLEQIDSMVAALASDPLIDSLTLSEPIKVQLEARRAA